MQLSTGGVIILILLIAFLGFIYFYTKKKF